VLIEVHDHDVLLDTVLVDQTQNSGQWNILGTYDFSGSARVVIIPNTDDCSTCADAAAFRPISSNQELEPESDSNTDQQLNPGNNPNDGKNGGCFISELQ
jgi:hypothetical protein